MTIHTSRTIAHASVARAIRTLSVGFRFIASQDWRTRKCDNPSCSWWRWWSCIIRMYRWHFDNRWWRWQALWLLFMLALLYRATITTTASRWQVGWRGLSFITIVIWRSWWQVTINSAAATHTMMPRCQFVVSTINLIGIVVICQRKVISVSGRWWENVSSAIVVPSWEGGCLWYC